MMKISARTGGVVGGVLGLIISVALIVVAATRTSPGGAGENLMWLSTYSAIWGFPLSLLWSPFTGFLSDLSAAGAYGLLLMTIPANWALLGVGVGGLVRWVMPGGRT